MLIDGRQIQLENEIGVVGRDRVNSGTEPEKRLGGGQLNINFVGGGHIANFYQF
jgi:hypothetical protein